MKEEICKKNTEIAERIAEMIKYLGETANSFAKKLGYERAQTIYDILNMKSAPSYDFFYRFLIAGYSENISVEWLIAGKGSMICQKVPSSSDNNTQFSIFQSLMEKIDEKDKKIEELNNKNQDLAGQVGYFKAKLENINKKGGKFTVKHVSTCKSSSICNPDVPSANVRSREQKK